MISIFKDSLLYRFFAAIGRWFSGQWLGSQIIRAFVTTKAADEVARSSIFYRPGKALRGVLSSIYLSLIHILIGRMPAKKAVRIFPAQAIKNPRSVNTH